MAPAHDVVVTDKVAQPIDSFVSLPELCERSDAIFLCVPINQIETVVQEMAPHVRPGTVVFDTCSVKVHPASVMRASLGDANVHLIATHPMFGPDSAAGGVTGLPMVVHRLKCDDAIYREWINFFEELGMRAVELSPEQHDQLAAYSQGVTHYVGRVLRELDLQATPIDTQGFSILRSLIAQTCNDSWELFRDLQVYNPYTSHMRARLEGALESVKRALE